MGTKFKPERTIKKLRIASQLTRAEFAEKADLSLAELIDIEEGLLRPSQEKMVKIANLLGVNVEYILFEEIKPH